MSYILDIARIAENKKSTEEAISIAINSMRAIDKIRNEGHKENLSTAITTVISGILQPPIGQLVSVHDEHVGTILTFPTNLTNYAADTMTGWYITMDKLETDIPEVNEQLEAQSTTVEERRAFKNELLKYLNEILHPVSVLDVAIVPNIWLGESGTPVSRVAVTIIVDLKTTPIKTTTDDGDFSIVDDEHVQ